MPGPAPAVAATRRALRAALADLPADTLVLAACSGGADSSALAAALAFVAPRAGLRAGAVVVDHGLQPGSDAVSRAAGQVCLDLGLRPVEVVAARVVATCDGPEADARAARHAALDAVAQRLGAGVLLLGHTRDDQAEQVLLGLVRGSGARSLAGMPSRRARVARPFLGLTRAQTEAACAAQGLIPWVDPHNADRAYTRVRARQALVDLERDLGPGVVAALARSADLLRQDADLLDELADTAYRSVGDPPDVARLADLPPALRRRVLRRLAVAAGASPGRLRATHVAALDALVVDWHGQGPVHLPGPVLARRVDGTLRWRRGRSEDTRPAR
ncbi:MAG: tRNA lysidine(34) synthetase TilS [Dermatophilaceae bacterium]